MDVGEPVKVLAFGKLEGRRGQGRSKPRWLNSTEENLKVLEVSNW
jgi:hypothetical protein